MGSVSPEGNNGDDNNRGAGDSIEVSRSHEFEVGDMVWGKVKSHPWWPGHVYSEELATPSVRGSKRDGLLLVAFFGDSSYGWFDPSELIPFDSNFSEKSLQTNSRTFVKAVEEAIDEVRRRSALGLSCTCLNKLIFRQTRVHGFLAVDVVGYDPGAVYSIDTIVKSRESFQTRLALDFVRGLALEPTDEHDDIDFVKNKATVMAYRRAAYEKIGKTYDQALGGDLVRPLPGSPGKKPAKAPLSGRQVFGDTVKSPNKPPKKDKYIIKRRDEIQHFSTSEDPTIASLKDSSSTMEDPTIANISTESNNTHDLEINTPISYLIHKNPSNIQKISVTKRPAGELSSPSPEKNPKRNKLAGELTSGYPENKRKRKIPEGESESSSHIDLQQALTNLHAFALDQSLHTNNRKLRSDTRKAILKFRSLLFQNPKTSLTEVSNSPVVKKPQVRRINDPTISGIKVEETTAKKLKKKKTTKVKTDEDKGLKSGQAVGQRAEEPTTLKMEFPSGVSLPSVSELKAKLGRYGKLDHDGTRIYWKTFTCLVVYRYKDDAEVALKAVERSKSLFGDIQVKYSLNKVSDSQPPVKVLNHQPKVDDVAAVVAPPKVDDVASVVATTVLIKSCLKKSVGEEGGEKKPRVKFNLTEEKSQNKKIYQFIQPPPPPPPRPIMVGPQINRPGAMVAQPVNVEFEEKMVRLLRRCNDVVAHVTGILGYVPYHPL